MTLIDPQMIEQRDVVRSVGIPVVTRGNQRPRLGAELRPYQIRRILRNCRQARAADEARNETSARTLSRPLKELLEELLELAAGFSRVVTRLS